MILLYGISAQIVIILPENLRQDNLTFPAATSISLKHTQVAIMNLRHHRVTLGMNHKHILIRLKATRRYINQPLHAILSQSATTLKNAAAQLEDVVTLYVEVVGEGKLTYGEQTAQKISISLPASTAGETKLADQNYSIAISDAKGDIQLKFSTVSSSESKQRAYLDEIKVVKNSTDGISAISVQKSDSKLYDLLGRSASKTGKGLRIINGKKVIF